MQIEHSNEIDLIRQTLAGNTSAFDQLVKTHRRTIYVLVFSYIKNPADADDLTQRIFIRAYERLSTLRQLDDFLPWLQQIAHNACKDWLRSRNDFTRNFGAVNDADFTETAPSPEELALKREIESVVREAIGALKETDRKLMVGRYIEGASYDQLQVESGLSYAAIANRLKRAKQQLRRRIEKLLGGMAILPGRTFIWGGIETVKLSVKTKLAAVGIVTLIGIGGGVLYYQTFESNPVVVNEQRGSGTEAVTEDTSTVETPKPSQADIEAAIVALENLNGAVKQTDTPPQNQESETVTEADTTELNPSPVSTEAQELSPEVKLKVEQYAKLAEILPLIRQLQQEFSSLVEESNTYSEQFRNATQQERAEAGVNDIEAGVNDIIEQLDVKIVEKMKEEHKYNLQIDELFPNLEVTVETPTVIDDGYVDHGGIYLLEERLVEYFGKELPWDGNTDYFQADDR